MKNDLINQLKSSENSIKDSLHQEIKLSEDNIKKDITEVKEEVNTNKTVIEELKTRRTEVERIITNEPISYADVAKKPPIEIVKKNDNTEVESVIRKAKMRVRVKAFTLEDINRVTKKEKVRGKDALKLAVKEFLVLELKIDEEEIKKLGEFDVSRKDDDTNDKVYLIF